MDKMNCSVAREQHIRTLSKWLWILFWLVIPCNAANMLVGGMMMGDVDLLILLRVVVSVASSVIYSFVLFKLGSLQANYRSAGIVILVGKIGAVAALIIAEILELDDLWDMVPTLSWVIGLAGSCYECNASSMILKGVDDALSRKWKKLCGWLAAALVVLLAAMLFEWIQPILSVVALVVAVVILAVTGIFRLVYLYRTAQIFRRIQ